MLKFLLTSLLALPCIAQAEDLKYTIKGFLGYNYMYQEHETGYLEHAPDIGMLFNADYKKLSLSLQFNYTGTEYVENLLTYGFVQYSDSVSDIPFELQVGKFKYEHGLYGGQLTNPRIRPSILPPQSIYWTPLRFNLTSAYGVKSDIYYKGFELSASIGQAISQDSDNEIQTWINIQPELIPASVKEQMVKPKFGSIFNVFLTHTSEHNKFKVEYGQYSGLIDGLENLTLGDEVQYNDFTVSIEAMFTNLLDNYHDISFLDLGEISQGYSLTLGYDVTDTFHTFVNFNTYDSKAPLPRGISPDRAEFKDLNFGFSWSLTDSLLLRGETHLMSGSRILPSKTTLRNVNDYEDYLVSYVGITYFFD